MSKKRNKRQGKYIPLEDIEKIDTAYLDEIERIKKRLTGVSDKDLINTFYSTLLNSYSSAIDMQGLVREVDYDIKLAEIEERKHNEKPFRRCWLWRLLFRPLTNRAQDIIEERAELNADVVHTQAEKAIEDDRKNLPTSQDEQVGKPSKRKLKRAMRNKLKAVIRAADETATSEAFNEPSEPQPQAQVQEPEKEPEQKQMQLDELPKPLENVRRARPPRACRKPKQ